MTTFVISNFTRDPAYHLKATIVSCGWHEWRPQSALGKFFCPHRTPEKLNWSTWEELPAHRPENSHGNGKQSEFGWSGSKVCARCAATQKVRLIGILSADADPCPAARRLALPPVPSWLPAGESSNSQWEWQSCWMASFRGGLRQPRLLKDAALQEAFPHASHHGMICPPTQHPQGEQSRHCRQTNSDILLHFWYI